MWNTISQSECPWLYHLSKQRYSHWQQPYSPPYSSDSTFQCSGSLNCYGLWLRYSCVENTHHSMLTTNVTDKSTFTEGISVLAQLVELLDIQTESPWIKSNQWYIGESCSDVVLGKFNQQYGRNDFTGTGLNSAWVTELCLGDWTLPGWLAQTEYLVSVPSTVSSTTVRLSIQTSRTSLRTLVSWVMWHGAVVYWRMHLVCWDPIPNRVDAAVCHQKQRRERNVLFNNALNTFYLRLYGIKHMVKDHSDSEKGNPLPPHRLLLSINSKGSFICTIPQTG